MDYNELCKYILDLDTNVRFAGVCDETGEIKSGGQREGLKNLLTPGETKMSNIQEMAGWALRNSLATKVGRGKYAMTEYEKIKRITFPIDPDHLLLVTTEVESEHMKLIDGILKKLIDAGG
ncbi:MAG TPA: hypothetical protein VEH06_04845 [Candidatus Bathyarchaeia archaeon]|nr:hypothetical protein [Candidatus Bathyarchaeia archaeon]